MKHEIKIFKSAAFSTFLVITKTKNRGEWLITNNPLYKYEPTHFKMEQGDLVRLSELNSKGYSQVN